MNDAEASLVIAAIFVALIAVLIAAGQMIGERRIAKDCENFGAFYIGDTRYNCEAQP